MTLERRARLERRTPLTSRAKLARSAPIRRGGSLPRSGRLRPVSDRRAAQADEHAVIRRQVFDRDHRCLLVGRSDAGRCWGPPTPHHIRKAGQGGPYTLLNLVQLCLHHNEWIETADGQPLALIWGLWCRNGDDLESCWRRLLAHGLVTYDPTGAPACP
jgi:hypothetical protein